MHDAPESMLRLNLGCGVYPYPGFINLDIDPSVNPDIVRDVTRGLPFGDESAGVIRAHHFLEHLDPSDFIFLVSECWRVLAVGGVLDVIVPLGITDDPTHRVFFHENSFNVFLDPEAQAYYRKGTSWSQLQKAVLPQKFPSLQILLQKKAVPPPVKTPSARPQVAAKVIDKDRRGEELAAILCKEGTLLHVGCGSLKHATLDVLAQAGHHREIVAVDAHDGTIADRKRWAEARPDRSRFHFIHSPIEKLRFQRRFDVVVMSHVIEHLDFKDAMDTLVYLRSLCDGQFLVETPNEFEGGQSAVNEYQPPFQRHQCLIEAPLMEALGFRKVFTYFQDSGFSNSLYEYRV